MNKNHIIIAIDGYSSTGKSSVSKELAKKLNIIHIDSGAMYRAITYFSIVNNYIQDNEINTHKIINQLSNLIIDFKYNFKNDKNEIYLNNIQVENEIRTIEVNRHVSLIAQIKEVRQFLVEQQREISKNQSLVMDGRDIGSIVFPNADFKFFITASLEERTKRRYLEINDSSISFEEVKNNLIERDENDTNRLDSPLIIAKDAILIDNTEITREQTIEKIYNIIYSKIKN
jgi:cytidylate kinase